MANGRKRRNLEEFAIEPLACGLPPIRSLGGITRRGPTKPAEPTASHYLSCLVPQRAERIARLERGHGGGCRISSHRVCGAFREVDATGSRNLNINGNPAVLRCALIALKTRYAANLTCPPSPFDFPCNNTLN